MSQETLTFGTTAAQQQRHAQAVLVGLYSALQALRLFPLENQTVQKALVDLHAATARVVEREGELEVALVGDFLFVNEVRVRLDLSTYAAFSLVSSSMQRHRVGTIRVARGVEREEWPPFLALLLQQAEAEEETFERFAARLETTPVRHLVVGPPRERPQLDHEAQLSKEAAKQAYFQTVEVARSVLGDVRLKKSVNARRVKRSVQNIVDQVLNNETWIMGMTALRDYDDYTFTHCVNVCIFSVVLGQKLGLPKLDLYELGVGGLLHDIGKMRVDESITKKPGSLTEAELRAIQEHPTEGLLALFNMHGFGEVPYRAMLTAYEHHMKTDLTGYPRSKRPRAPGLFSRIVAVADAFDAATSVRCYQALPKRPEDALEEMRDNEKRGLDPLLVKALINVTGIYPVGTLVFLDTFELAVVTAANPDREKLHQPVVKVIYDARGVPLAEPVTVNLAVDGAAEGRPRRRVIKTTRPDSHGIDVGAYFL